jgi:hypothetical protein
MKTMDIFVHPTFGWINTLYVDGIPKDYSDRYTKAYEIFLEREKEVLSESELPVLVNGFYGIVEKLLGNTVFGEDIPKERRFRSYMHRLGRSIMDEEDLNRIQDSGVITTKSEWNRFTTMIDKEKADFYRIHGCNIGECPEDLAVQLFGYLKRGDHWRLGIYQWAPSAEKATDADFEQKAIKNYAEKGDFAKSSIKYGVVLMPPSPFEEWNPSSLTRQFMNEKTEVFGL